MSSIEIEEYDRNIQYKSRLNELLPLICSFTLFSELNSCNRPFIILTV